MPERGELENIAKEAVTKIEGNSVLDVGTGFGTLMEQVLTTTGCNLTSIDPEAWRFDELRDRYETEISTGRLELLKEGIGEIESDGRTFDTTISISSLHHLNNLEDEIGRMEKMSRKRIVLADWNEKSAGIYNPHSEEDLRKPQKDAIQYMKDNSYNVVEEEYWYLGWKDL